VWIAALEASAVVAEPDCGQSEKSISQRFVHDGFGHDETLGTRDYESSSNER
jgi:hypothetical protein